MPVLLAALKLPPPAEQRKGVLGKVYTVERTFLHRMDDSYRAPSISRCSTGRRY